MTQLHSRDIPTVDEIHFRPNLHQQRNSDCIWRAKIFVTAKRAIFNKFLTKSNGHFTVRRGDVLEYLYCRVTNEVLFRFFKHRITDQVIKTSCWYIGDELEGCIRKPRSYYDSNS